MAINKAISKVWSFKSGSSSKLHETLQYADGSTSCNCMGWTRHVKPDGTRSCKHTRSVDMGRADLDCESCHDYNAGKAKPTVKVEEAPKITTTPPPPAKPKRKKGTLVARKISWK